MLVSFGLIIKYFLTFLIALILTPIFKIISVQTGLVDNPNARRMNQVPMPSAGGLPIFITFAISSLFLFRDAIPFDYISKILLGALIIVITGLLDDKFELSPKQKSIGILLAGLVIYYYAGIRFDFFTAPLFGRINLEWLSLPATLFWICLLYTSDAADEV
ncbi:undecaprenyl/decaprenyl-phosphate alpha-N-acetylglucosaminyl 1-phosphate transferase, partial [Enterococcus sp. S181_ASV_20]|nr:undecaprenyl/decaprenyl-phosphate alpha-N-acetylglucosaminyl 1-phosphate transferase [Enterococcus sp. S181_ASV_20]